MLQYARGASQFQIGNDISLLQGGSEAAGTQTLSQILTTLSLTTNLKLCLDAGDSASYSSGQSWLDRSGGGFDFFRGATSGAEASDPTFNGSAGGLSSSEYWSFDGGDYFLYDSAQETWMDALHKDNAIWSWCAWAYFGSVATAQAVIGDAQGVGNGVGVSVYVNSTASYKLRVHNTGQAIDLTFATTTVSAGAWHFLAGSLNEATGANGANLFLDGTNEQFTSTYTSPAAGTATGALRLGGTGNNTSLLQSGSRLAEVAMWQGTALTPTDLTNIFNASKGRFGL